MFLLLLLLFLLLLECEGRLGTVLDRKLPVQVLLAVHEDGRLLVEQTAAERGLLQLVEEEERVRVHDVLRVARLLPVEEVLEVAHKRGVVKVAAARKDCGGARAASHTTVRDSHRESVCV